MSGLDGVDVILIDDEPHLRMACAQALDLAGLKAAMHGGAERALDGVGPDWAGVIVTDVKMPGMSGLDLLRAAQARDPGLPVVLISGHGDIPMAVDAMRDGAYDFLEKPFAPERLVETVRRALETRRLLLENRALRSALAQGAGLEKRLVGATPAMKRLREMTAAYAATDADVLILGETGAGKELVARGLHELSDRRDAPFVAINCSALPETIVESELFGHEPGAFTGAQKLRIGKFEHADGGTLFLDEIETMPLEMQARLLRVLQERCIVRLGANEERPVDLRIVAASKADLATLSESGGFRADLYYRLNVLTLPVPPLRERREDIPVLFAHFVEQAATRINRPAPELGPSETARLIAHDWPGNVRELENAAMRFGYGFGLSLGASEPETAEAAPSIAPQEGSTLADQLAAVERAILAQTLAQNGGSMRRTYEQLGVSRKTLYDKLRRHGLRGEGDGDGEDDAADE